MKHLHLVLPEPIYDLLRKEAFEKKKSLAEVVRNYLPSNVAVHINGSVPLSPLKVPGEKKASEMFPKGILAEGRGTQGYCNHGYNPRTCKFEECRKKVTW